jgi:hypothetical protein
MAAARSVRRLRSAESANSRSTALREVPRRAASASTSLRRSSGIDTMTFAIRRVYRGIRLESDGSRSGCHTVLRASAGASRAARIAGSSPATAPISSAAAKPPAQAEVGITIAHPLVVA